MLGRITIYRERIQEIDVQMKAPHLLNALRRQYIIPDTSQTIRSLLTCLSYLFLCQVLTPEVLHQIGVGARHWLYIDVNQSGVLSRRPIYCNCVI